MLTGPEERLVATLGKIEIDRKQRRDFPPELSLPSVAQSLGVVRSALHQPISSLESKGIVRPIKSNVIGERRKRTVLILTKKGLAISKQLGLSDSNDDDLKPLLGRENEIEDLMKILRDPGIVVLTGLPGIGKSSVAREVLSRYEKLNKSARWHTCDLVTNMSSLMESWSGLPIADDHKHASGVLDSHTLYILDEAQEIHEINTKKIRLLIECSEHARILIVTRGQTLFSSIENAKKLTLEGLSHEFAAEIRANLDPKKASQVSIALGGHPLAIKMWREGDEIPAPGTPVAKFIRTTVLDRLDSETGEELENLIIEPFPIPVKSRLGNKVIDKLDDASILKWTGLNFEATHLIRNVGSAAMGENKKQSLHGRLASRWSNIEGPIARGFELHHLISAGHEISVEMASNVLDKAGPSVASVLLANALERGERSDLRLLAAQAALSLGEATKALEISKRIENKKEQLMIEMECYRLMGLESKYYEIEKSIISEAEDEEKATLLVRGAVLLHDDRLPGYLTQELGRKIIQRLDELQDIEGKVKLSLSSSSLFLRYIVASDLGEAYLAASLRSLIVQSLGEGHPRLEETDLKLRLKSWNENIQIELRERISTTQDKYEKLKLIHWGLLATEKCIPKWLIEAHEECFMRDEPTVRKEHGRIEAFSWFWRGVINPDQRLYCWTESSKRLRSCGCSNASSELIERIHGEIRFERQ